MAIYYTDNIDRLFDDLVKSKRVAFDIETTGLDPKSGHILLLQFCCDAAPDDAYVLPVNKLQRFEILTLMNMLSEKIVLAHNAKFEVSWVYEHYKILLEHVYCSMISERILTAGLNERADLAGVALRLLGKEIAKDLQKSFIDQDPKTFEPSADQIKYAGEDVLLLHEIRKIQVDELIRKGLVEVAMLEFNCVPIFSRIELKGLYLDREAHAAVIIEQEKVAEESSKIAIDKLSSYWQRVQARQQADAAVKFDNLTQKINTLLEPYGGRLSARVPEDVKLDVETLRRVRRKPKPDRNFELSKRQMVLDTLVEAGIHLPNLKAATVNEYLQEHLEKEELRAYRKWAQANKIVTTYGHTLVEHIHGKTKRIHPSFNQVISTGRVSSNNPNGQNLPPEIRRCFKPAPGYQFVILDFMNQELRVAGALSEDPVVIDAFKEGKDLHSMTAAAAFPHLFNTWKDVDQDSKERKLSKVTNFAILYGGTAYTLYIRQIIDHLETAEAIVKGIERAYPTMMKWLRKEGERAVKIGYAKTALGRKRFFPTLPEKPDESDETALKDWHKKRRKQVREAMNHPIQGSSADQAKMALVLLSKELGPDDHVVCVVHDELLLEVPEDRSEIVADIAARCMLQAGKDVGITLIDIPAEVHIKPNWDKKGKKEEIVITKEEEELGLVELVDSEREEITA